MWSVVARLLGWLGIALGIAQVVAPRRTAALMGTRRASSTRAMPVLGAREIASGVGILASGRPTGWLWTRVLGDVIDLVVLGRSLRGARRYTRRPRLLASVGTVLALAALDIITAWVFTQRRRRARFLDRVA
jgi:hypothetical protein